VPDTKTPEENPRKYEKEQIMSAAVLEFAPRPAVRSAVPAPRLRITRRGRAVLMALIATPLVVIAMVIALNGGGAVATGDASTVELEHATVMPGQTMWELAEEYAPNADPRDFIADVYSLNNLGGSLQAGQDIAIPAKYSN
jgi:hypothetical protein